MKCHVRKVGTITLCGLDLRDNRAALIEEPEQAISVCSRCKQLKREHLHEPAAAIDTQVTTPYVEEQPTDA